MKPQYYPSEIATARRCWRRWAGKYLFRIRIERERPEAGALGDEVHDLHERYNKIGQAPVPDRTVADNLLIAGLPYLPAPRTGQTEAEAKITLNGVSYAMRRDWVGFLSELPQTEGLRKDFGDTPAQLDLKTSSQPLRYGIWTRERFLDDTQFVLEGLELAERHNADVIGSRWLYFQTPKKSEEPKGSGNWVYKLRGKVEAFPSDIVLGRDALGRAHLKVIEPFARGIIELREQHAAAPLQDFRQLPHPDDYETSESPCFDFRGCDFLHLCKGTFRAPDRAAIEKQVSAGYGQTAQQGLGAPQGLGESMSLFPPLAQQLAQGQGVAPAIPPAHAHAQAFVPAVPPAPAQAFVPATSSVFVPQVPAMPAAAPAAPPPAAPPPAAPPPAAPAAPPPVPQAPSILQVPVVPGFTGINAPEVAKYAVPAPVLPPVAPSLQAAMVQALSPRERVNQALAAEIEQVPTDVELLQAFRKIALYFRGVR